MAATKQFSLEEAPVTPFLRRLTVCCSGGPFLDGYILVIIGVALPQLVLYLKLDAFWSGMIGAASLAGLFVGGTVFGYVTDLVGRKIMYILTPALLAIVSVAQMVVSTPLELFVLRFIIGMVVGADYSIATSLLTEFSPKKRRGMMIGILATMWFVGATAADFFGYFIRDMAESWRWMLGSAVVPSLLLLAGRWGTPESPRWLVSKGRTTEALAVMRGVYGPDADLADFEQSTEKTRFSKLFEKGYLSRTLFSGLYWSCHILPLYAIYTFGPAILESLHLGHGKQALLGDSVISFVFILGCIPAMALIESVGRRPLIIWSFVFMTLGMLILGLFPDAPVWVIMSGFAIYALAAGGPGILEWIYPNELFPTEVRASAVGMATGISRVGACLGTFALPHWLATLGIGATMLIMTAVTFAGLIICLIMAPETKGLTLSQAGAVPGDTPAAAIPERS
jgi:MFS transporter, putative metabolite transport protein